MDDTSQRLGVHIKLLTQARCVSLIEEQENCESELKISFLSWQVSLPHASGNFADLRAVSSCITDSCKFTLILELNSEMSNPKDRET